MPDTSKGRTLIDRATTISQLHNYLEYKSPDTKDHIKKAYVTVGDKGIKATPISPKRNKIAEMYGKKPTLVAEELDPMALIEKASPQDRLFPQYQGYGNKLVRSVLRRIVDEV